MSSSRVIQGLATACRACARAEVFGNGVASVTCDATTKPRSWSLCAKDDILLRFLNEARDGGGGGYEFRQYAWMRGRVCGCRNGQRSGDAQSGRLADLTLGRRKASRWQAGIAQRSVGRNVVEEEHDLTFSLLRKRSSARHLTGSQFIEDIKRAGYSFIEASPRARLRRRKPLPADER